MNRNRSPQLIKLIIALECVLLCAFLILLSPVGVLFSNSVPVNGQKAENAKQNTREDDTDNTKSQNEEEPEQKKEMRVQMRQLVKAEVKKATRRKKGQGKRNL